MAQASQYLMNVDKIEDNHLLSANINLNCSLPLWGSSVFTSNKFYLNSQQGIQCWLVFSVNYVKNDHEFSLQVNFEEKVMLLAMTVIFHIENTSEAVIFQSFDKTADFLSYNFKTVVFKHSSQNSFNNPCNDCGCYNSYSNIQELKIVNGSILYRITNDMPTTWLNSMRYLFKSNEYSDLTITVNGDMQFYVHKLVVTHKSRVLKKMIDSDMLEKNSNNIVLDGIDPLIMNEVITYMYEGCCDLTKGAPEIFRVAHMYELYDLTRQCECFLLHNINIKDVVEILKLVGIDSYNLNDLRLKITKFINDNELELVNDVNFIKYHMDTMNTTNIHYMFRLAMQYNLNVAGEVKQFISMNLKEVIKNNEFKNLIEIHPQWSINVFEFLSEFFPLQK